ncbi:MAG: hypothetical protein ABFQ95_02540 [Pseudomonadota bacterium]
MKPAPTLKLVKRGQRSEVRNQMSARQCCAETQHIYPELTGIKIGMKPAPTLKLVKRNQTDFWHLTSGI